MKKKVLGIFCHPDDEVLFGWPIFQSDEYEKYLIICCDDSCRNRPERKKALYGVCLQEKIAPYSILSEGNNFYALPTRRADYLLTDAIENISRCLEEAITNIEPDYIFTHNPVGEYGHGSHRLLFEIVSQHPKVKNLLITDMCQRSNHRSNKEIPQIIKEVYYNHQIFLKCISEKLDMNFYNRCKVIYDRYNAWTWSKPPIEHCNLYLLKDKNA